MDGVQAERTLAAAQQQNPELEDKWREFYNWSPGEKPSYGPPRAYNARLGYLVRELCDKYSLLDRMPRHIIPGPTSINKRIAERLFLRTYDLELELATNQRVWAYRKAAWTVDELGESIGDLYEDRGEAGLRELPTIGVKLAALIARWLQDEARREEARMEE
jgi:hypothetical protein